ncbi:hypothetical protein GLOIN_2v1589258, partial [Rhizophagus irregularis DAOM 181602=DAOM 197198]
MSVLCFLHFFTKLIYPFLEVASRICPEFFHVRNLSSSNYLNFYYVRNLSRFICPEFVQNFYTGQILDIFWTKSGYVKILGIKFVAKNRHFPDNFWTCQIYSGQFPDIFVDIFRTFIFYRESVNIMLPVVHPRTSTIHCIILWQTTDIMTPTIRA